MKNDIHPQYQFVVYKDTSSEFSFLSRSTQSSQETVTWEDGNEYPLISIEISSASHPFYTGKQTLVDTAGRVERFRRRYNIKPTEDAE
jgi:large subunit ribosomal protein L31